MYSLRLICPAEHVDRISGELWDAGTAGIHEADVRGRTILIAFFETNRSRAALLAGFSAYSPEWNAEGNTDWAEKARQDWPAREVGGRIFLAPPWNREATPAGRERVVHNPGLACGTGEHPCSRLALIALEKCVDRSSTVADIGTGSGILAIASLLLGAKSAVGIDIDETAFRAAKENFELNGMTPMLTAGSAECLADSCADIVIANISATVLLSMLDDLLRITRAGGWLILTGFPESETAAFMREFPGAEAFAEDDWRCVTVRISSSA